MDTLYLAVFRWAMGLIYQNTIPIFPDNGPYTPTFVNDNPNEYKFTKPEDVMLMTMKLLGIAFWSLTISKVIHAITVLGNPATIAYQQDIDAVNRFCTFNRLPTRLARELRRYMYNTREVHASRTRAAIYNKLSPLLVAKVTKLLNRPLFESQLLRRALTDIPAAEGERFVAALVTASTMAVFSPGDRPPAGRLYLITEGVAIHKLFQFLSVGDCWGDEDVLLGSRAYNRETKSMTYLRVIWVSRDDFRNLEGDFPEPYGKMRRYTIWKRARRILKAAVNKQKAKDRTLALKARLSAQGDSFGKAKNDAGRDDSFNKKVLAAGKLLVGNDFVSNSADNAAPPIPPPNGPSPPPEATTPEATTAIVRSVLDGPDLRPESGLVAAPPLVEQATDETSTAAGGAYGARDGGAAFVAEEVLQAIDMIGGLVIETRRGVDDRCAEIANDVIAIGETARASHAAVIALTEQLEQMRVEMGLTAQRDDGDGDDTTPDSRALRLRSRSPSRSPHASANNGMHQIVVSPLSDAQRQQSARARAAFRAIRADKYGVGRQ